MSNSRGDLMADLMDLWHHLENIVSSEELRHVSQFQDFPDSRVFPYREKEDNFKRLSEIIRENDQIRNNESVQLALRCLSILLRCPKTAETCLKDVVEFFSIFHNVTAIVLTVSRFLAMTLLEFATENSGGEDKMEFEDVLRFIHKEISKNEQRFQDIAKELELPNTDKMKPNIASLNTISGQSGADMQECAKKMQDLLIKRRISAEPDRIRKKSAWSLVSLGAVTFAGSGEATVTMATGDTAKKADSNQEFLRIHDSCQVFLEDLEKLTKQLSDLQTVG